MDNKHKCDKMPSEVFFNRDLSYIEYHYDHENEKTIYYCRYCGQPFKVQIEEDISMNRLESIKEQLEVGKKHDTKYSIPNDQVEYLLQRLERYETALQGIVQKQGNIRPDGEAWEYVGEFKASIKLAKEALKDETHT